MNSQHRPSLREYIAVAIDAYTFIYIYYSVVYNMDILVLHAQVHRHHSCVRASKMQQRPELDKGTCVLTTSQLSNTRRPLYRRHPVLVHTARQTITTMATLVQHQHARDSHRREGQDKASQGAAFPPPLQRSAS